ALADVGVEVVGVQVRGEVRGRLGRELARDGALARPRRAGDDDDAAGHAQSIAWRRAGSYRQTGCRRRAASRAAARREAVSGATWRLYAATMCGGARDR